MSIHLLGALSLQVDGGDIIVIRDCITEDSDQDGVAVANATNITIDNHRGINDSKSSVYVNNCTNYKITKCVITDSGGHLVSGSPVGSGIQASSNTNGVISDNKMITGTGYGLLLNALSGGAKPFNTNVHDNYCSDITNPTNLSVLGGFYYSNGNVDKETETRSYNNTAVRVERNPLYYENHDGIVSSNDQSIEAQRQGLIVSTINNARIYSPKIYNANTDNNAGTRAISLTNTNDDVKIFQPQMEDLAIYATGFATQEVDVLGTTTALRVEYPTQDFLHTWQPNGGASIASYTGVTETGITATGVQLEEGSIEAIAPFNLNGAIAEAYVQTSNTAAIAFFNATGASRTYASGEWILRYSRVDVIA